MTNTVYPLLQVIDVKKKRVQDAEKVVREKKEALEREIEKLKLAEEHRAKVKQHHEDKLTQMRQTMDEGTTSTEILQMKVYLKVVKERLKEEDKKVADQKEQVAAAEKSLELAKLEVKRKQQEVDKLLTHRADWEKEMRKELEIIEGREQDEMGSIIFTTHQMKQRR